MKKRVLFLVIPISIVLNGATIHCEIENSRVYCKYFLDRSDNQKGKKVEFHWISPASPVDDRIRHFMIPPLHGSVYDYRFLPGRVEGRWRVKVTELDTNRSVETFFDIDGVDNSLFDDY